MAASDIMDEDRSYTFEKGRTGALLLHGLGGTPVEMRYVAMGLARAGVTVSCPQLAGHSGSVEDLRDSRWQDWLASAEAALDALRCRCDTVIVGGLSMGAVLALRAKGSESGEKRAVSPAAGHQRQSLHALLLLLLLLLLL